MAIRNLNGGWIVDEASGEPEGVSAKDESFEYVWDKWNVHMADFKDIDGILAAAVAACEQGTEDVININDGSDSYIFANESLARKKWLGFPKSEQ